MKKIYSGPALAAVILDNEQEIQIVLEALTAWIPGPDQRETADKIYAELSAPAPE